MRSILIAALSIIASATVQLPAIATTVPSEHGVIRAPATAPPHSSGVGFDTRFCNSPQL